MTEAWPHEDFPAFSRVGTDDVVDGPIARALRDTKKCVVDAATGHADGWAQKVHEGKTGVLVRDIPAFLGALGFEVHESGQRTVDGAGFDAACTLIARLAPFLPQALEKPPVK